VKGEGQREHGLAVPFKPFMEIRGQSAENVAFSRYRKGFRLLQRQAIIYPGNHSNGAQLQFAASGVLA
jgi:hypothetical protein